MSAIAKGWHFILWAGVEDGRWREKANELKHLMAEDIENIQKSYRGKIYFFDS